MHKEFNNAEFNIVELINEVIRKSARVLLEAENVEIKFDDKQEYIVNADAFYIEQVITNYLTNAIKNVGRNKWRKIYKYCFRKK